MNVTQALQIAVQHHRAGRLADAEQIYQEILQNDPNQPDALHLLGRIALTAGNLDLAEALIHHAATLGPQVALFQSSLTACRRQKAERLVLQVQKLRAQNQIVHAIDLCRQAIMLSDQCANAFDEMGVLQLQQNDLNAAHDAFQQAVQIDPSLAYRHRNLGTVLLDQKQFDEAWLVFERSIQIDPNYGEAHINLALMLADQGNAAEALERFELGVSRVIPDPSLGSCRLFLLESHPTITPPELFEQHQKWAKHFGEFPAAQTPYANDPNPNRRLRIGYVSSDFQDHPVMCFARPIFANHTPEQVEVFCYSNTVKPDSTTPAIQQLVPHWRDLVAINDEEAARIIRNDQIDILVDLNGHTGNNRLPLFARKPAPIQVTYLGYPNTSGLTSIDYRLTDAFADPPGESDSIHSEQLIRLKPTFLCFEPKERPPIEWSAKEHIVFGSFNAVRKMNGDVVKCWSEILKNVPGSKLMMKAGALRSQRCRRNLVELFASHGVSEDRLIFRQWETAPSDHLTLYNEVDIALDPFPYNGTTTTCEALWMGVPVIVLAGQTHRARVGVSILSNVGLPELIGATLERYVSIAIELAGNRERLANLRGTLRGRLQNSPLMDAAGFVRELESAYRSMWVKWCATSEAQT